MRIILDTNIIYYLVGLSSDSNFNIEKFNEDVKVNNQELSITYFTLFEILTKFGQRKTKSILHKILSFLHENHIGIYYDFTSKISHKNIYKKCLNSSNKCKYYKNHLRFQVQKYFSSFLSDMLLLLGGIYLHLIYLNEKNENAYNKSIMYINKFYEEFFINIKNNIDEMYNDYFTSYEMLKIRKENRKNKFISILQDVFKLIKVLYKCFNEISVEELKKEEQVENIKNLVRLDNSINIEEANILFKQFRGNKNFDIEFQNLYLKLYSHRNTDTRNDVFRFILSYLLKGQNFDFNDISDFVNLITPKNLALNKDIFYLTSDKKWIEFLNENKTNTYYNKTLMYLEKYINVKSV